MKYFDEEKMAGIRIAFDKEVLRWKGVVSWPMMGCRCYFYNRKFIGFLVTDGIVIMKLSEKDQAALKEEFGGKAFEMAGQTGRLWVTPLKAVKDLRPIMPFVRKRYEVASMTIRKPLTRPAGNTGRVFIAVCSGHAKRECKRLARKRAGGATKRVPTQMAKTLLLSP